MKKIYFGAALLFIGLTSCSSDDSNSTDSDAIFLPLTTTSSWVYDVSVDTEHIGRDSLYVSGETTLNNKTYQQLKTKEMPMGFYSNALNNNAIRKVGDKLLLSGSTGLALADFFPLDINVNDFVIFKENASVNAQLDVISGTIQQDLSGFPLDITYNLKSTFKESLDSFTVPGLETYSNVKVIKLIVNLKVTTDYIIPNVDTPVTVPVLNSQDAIISTQYYAEGVGVIYSKTEVNFEINQALQNAGDLPLPQNTAYTVEEFLD